ncbi:hypothetical protein ACIGJO_23065 [Streptomyces sp. NPDC079020]|uniref:hypothetical protein n=1 Tax=Streptomyces sp. NPDC079020 TaxID=3365722 RepID=UPI0037D7D258
MNGESGTPDDVVRPDTRENAVAALPRTGAGNYTLRKRGVFDQALGLDGVDAYSKVVACMTEVEPIASKPFLGGATMTVHNVVAQDGGTVRIRGEVASQE